MDAPADATREAARRSGVLVLALFGSRARGDDHPGSDWDFAYLPGRATDPEVLRTELVLALGTDDVDLVDLSTASALLRFRASADGRLVHEAVAGAFEAFQIEAARFWCDVAPVLRATYDDVLDSLPS